MNYSTPLVKYAFLVFSLSGIGVALYLVYEIMYPRKNWNIEIVGNVKQAQKKEITDTIAYFIKINQNQISKKSLEDILKLNPRVADVISVDISSNKKIVIDIKLEKTAYVYHHPQNDKFQEVSLSHKVIEEDINNFSEIQPEIPVLCLTTNHSFRDGNVYAKGGILSVKMRRDIISTFKETKQDYAFVWRSISEICFTRHLYYYTIYSNNTRSRIQTDEKFDTHLLRRLWAVLYYLQSNFKTKLTKVRLNRHNAYVKVVHAF